MSGVMADQAPVDSVSFSGHETFVLRYGWLKKAVDAVGQDPAVFHSADAVVQLGVGKNMVRSIRHWALATGVLAESPGTRGAELQPSAIGKLFFRDGGRDPFLEDRGTLWLLHWLLVTNDARSTTWSWSFNGLSAPDFNTDKVVAFIFDQLSARRLRLPSAKTLQRDVECFLRCYAPTHASKAVLEESLDCPFVELGLLEPLDTGRSYRFRRGYQKTLTDEVFAFAVADYWTRRAPDRTSLGFADLAFGRNSPGAVFKLDEDSLAARLEEIESSTSGAFRFGETAGLKQLQRSGELCPMTILGVADDSRRAARR
jgi:Protein of unknown function (DUF4007)